MNGSCIIGAVELREAKRASLWVPVFDDLIVLLIVDSVLLFWRLFVPVKKGIFILIEL